MLLATHPLGIRPRARLIHEDDSHESGHHVTVLVT